MALRTGTTCWPWASPGPRIKVAAVAAAKVVAKVMVAASKVVATAAEG